MHEKKWQHSLIFGCYICRTTTCCLSCVGMPKASVLFGQTNYRLGHPEDSTARGYHCPNKLCALHCLATYIFCPLVCLIQCTQRGNIRHRLDIEGSACNDCCISIFCPCCELVQMEHEVRDWQIRSEGYHKQQQMTYAASETIEPSLGPPSSLHSPGEQTGQDRSPVTRQQSISTERRRTGS
ncbi:hypothetical protein EV356DRAFT_195526 [Viridothelium virens]|uniref:PLAC8-domain-containing protein n=1 Tax=Viridothelium virens TaxID=1048519 RepID=A0A6A6H6V0_VIRVR|nr:hypothetical protein EV356DRAFT_195526 [Viridothelium virens]